MSDETPVVEQGVVSMPDEAWEKARRRAAVIGPLAARPSVSQQAADAAAERLGLSRRQIYVLLERWRRGSGVVSDLAVGHSDGGRGRGRLSEAVEAVIADVLRGCPARRGISVTAAPSWMVTQ
jgi:putative transposase